MMLLKSLNKITVACLGAVFFASALADQTTQSTAPQSPADAINATLVQELCPPLESLTQNTDSTWSAPGGWKSNSPSFLKSITSFEGAQWAGVNLGQVICIYSKGGNRFPVNLERPQLAISPSGGGWTSDKGGYKDCASNDQKQCRFFTTKEGKPVNVYDEIDFYKGKPVDNY